MSKVYIVGNEDYVPTHRMFIANDWGVVDNPDEADLLQFTGGADVDPSLYGDAKHAYTHSDPARDAREAHIFNTYVGEKPMVGFCRGGQFLNVMCGGKMWQHVDKHGRSHLATTNEGEELEVTSSHHQMIIPNDDYALILLTSKVSTTRETATHLNKNKYFMDMECVYYPANRCLCYQPHPEYVSRNDRCQSLYFEFINNYIGLM